MSYLIEHTILHDGLFINGHLNWFHLAFIAVALGIMIFCWRRVKKMKDEMKDLEDQLSVKAADATIGLKSEATENPPAEAAAET